MFSRILRTILRYKLVSTIIAVLTTALVGGPKFILDRLGDVQAVDTAMVSLAGPNWLAHFVASPWFQIAALCLAAGLLWWIGKQAEKGELKDAERTASLFETQQGEINVIVADARRADLAQLEAVITRRTEVIAQVAQAKFAEERASVVRGSVREMTELSQTFEHQLLAIKAGENDGQRTMIVIDPIKYTRMLFLHSLNSAVNKPDSSHLKERYGRLVFDEQDTVVGEALGLSGVFNTRNRFHLIENGRWIAAQDSNANLMAQVVRKFTSLSVEVDQKAASCAQALAESFRLTR